MPIHKDISDTTCDGLGGEVVRMGGQGQGGEGYGGEDCGGEVGKGRRARWEGWKGGGGRMESSTRVISLPSQ